MKGYYDIEKLKICKFLSLLITLLGYSMVFVNFKNHNMFMVCVSAFYGTYMLIAFIIISIRKELTIFYINAISLMLLVEIVYLWRGGTEGVDIIWVTLFSFLSLYLLGFRKYIILNSITTLIVILALWTPLSQFCYPFSKAFRIRFPVIIFIEYMFGIFLKTWISRTENARNQYYNELTDLKENLENQVAERTKELEDERNNRELLMYELVSALSATIDAKDKYTSGHSLRVALYARELAKRMKLSEKEQENIYLFGLLHDIGKISIPDEIINKNSKLSDDEYSVIKQHPVKGSEILSTIRSMPEILEGARSHHERWDGKGYPDQLVGEKIPVAAQIISVADAYDAMTSNRSYRTVLTQEKVRSEIENGMGTQFSPAVASVMLQIIDEDVHYLLHE